ncbi:hypothetical protein ACFP47_11525 [Nesterenkonia lacusekhoensis]|uniref:Uncharacterized protein n=1 Tax=Nesterenkonia lacusekhoensis TaxID=150832 RepID=A0ABS4T4U6_9MICC|nr:hypothetical protein [Nesterenkonia lacusekhoensis]MBP2319488.1 hypothetical protein [Nesterenkonia lacusekhoensis]
MTVYRQEDERANWLIQHEITWTQSDRRQAQRLKRKAAKLAQKEAGAADSSFHEARIPWFPARFIAHGDDPKEQFARIMTLVLIIAPAMVLLAGPAMLLAKGLYAVSWLVLPPKGRRILWWPWLVASTAVGVVGYFALSLLGLFDRWLYLEPRFPLVFIDYGVLVWQYGWVQLALGLALVAWIVRCTGWPGVKKQEAAALPTMPESAAAPSTVPALPAVEKTTGELEDPDDEDFVEVVDDETPEPAEAAPHDSEHSLVPVLPAGNDKKEASDG